MSILKEIFKSTLDFILPQSCLICNTEIESGMLCHKCLDYIPEVIPPFCKVCGRPLKKGRNCRYCSGEMHIDYGRAWALFIPPVDKIIHHFKYRKKHKLSIFLGQAMATIIRSDHILRNADVLIPVPLFWYKRLRRGYNQAALLSAVISSECNISSVDAMKRIKYTKTQTKLSEEARRKNVFNAFSINSDRVENKNVILIDDVLTTGVTMNECARVLKEAGVKQVYSCVAAITA